MTGAVLAPGFHLSVTLWNAGDLQSSLEQQPQIKRMLEEMPNASTVVDTRSRNVKTKVYSADYTKALLQDILV